jgi:ADP-ribosylglycohydrolase
MKTSPSPVRLPRSDVRPLVDPPISYAHDRALLGFELDLLAEQGLPKVEVAELREELAQLPERPRPAVFLQYWNAMSHVSSTLALSEPTELAAIQTLRPTERVALPPMTLSRDQLRERIEAAWTARAVGCLLGKPVEGWSREKIESYLKDDRAQAVYGRLYPLANYIPGNDDLHRIYQFHSFSSVRDKIAGAMPRDDDMDYPIIALITLERAGRDFSTEDIAETWKKVLPYGQTYTAERIAYANLVGGIDVSEAGRFANPYREWIGAQIRADVFGYVNPGNPERAAEMAWRDAVLTHTGNGVYGEMFFAALIAAAFSADSLDQALDAAIAQIPAGSRFAQMVSQVREWERCGLDWDACWNNINQSYGDLHWVHTLNNAAMAIAALLYGKGDFDKTITLSVLAGYDTDSNGATVGSVFGALFGPQALPEKWLAPIDGKLHSAVFGNAEVRFSELAERAMKLVELEGCGPACSRRA